MSPVVSLEDRLLLLSRQEVDSLTGYTRPDAQMRWLRANNWTFTRNGSGRICIARDEFQRRMVGESPASTAGAIGRRKPPQLNLEAVNARRRPRAR